MVKTNVEEWPVQISVSFPKKDAQRIEAASKELGVSKSEYIRRMVAMGEEVLWNGKS